jgi:hypothetical protein
LRDEPDDSRYGNLTVAEKLEVHILFGVVPRVAGLTNYLTSTVSRITLVVSNSY